MTAAKDIAFRGVSTGAALVAGFLAVQTYAFGQVLPPHAPHATVSLVAETLAVAPGGTLQVALREEIEPGWHTYWINPGDSGLPTTIEWTLPPGFTAGQIAWPTPEVFRSDAIVDYGYEGDVLLPLTIAVPAELGSGTAVTLSGHANWLACAKICVPEEADFALTLPVGAAAAVPDPQWAERFQAVRAASPIESPFPATMALDHDNIELHLAMGGADKVHDVVFFPLDGGIVDNDAEQHVETTPDGMTIRLARGELKSKPLDRLNGVLTFRRTGSDGADQSQAIKISAPAAAAAQ